MDALDFEFDILPGKIYCLHFRDGLQMKLVKNAVLKACRTRGLCCIAGPVPALKSWIHELLIPTKCVHWLAKNAGIPLSQAKQIIDQFPINIHPKLSHNAGNARKFLQYTAAAATSPAVVLFDTLGLPPAGRKELFKYVTETIGGSMAVHLNLNADDGSFVCPTESVCRDVSPTKLEDAT